MNHNATIQLRKRLGAWNAEPLTGTKRQLPVSDSGALMQLTGANGVRWEINLTSGKAKQQRTEGEQ